MPETDTPLKQLLYDFAPEYAAWLLNVDVAQIRYAQPLNIELSAGTLRSDTVFRVWLADEREVLLHVEFQGARSDRPMSWRMLDYVSRLAQREEAQCLESVVIYVGAGLRDTGEYCVAGYTSAPTLAWRYRVIRLWQMSAAELLALGRPALLPLIGQTQLRQPRQELQEVVATLKHLPSDADRARLFAALSSLLPDKEALEMLEQLIEFIAQDPLLETPYLRRMREKGIAEGLEKGLAEGRAEGRAEGILEGVLDVITLRFTPSIVGYRRLEQRLKGISDIEKLRALLQAALQAADLVEFEQTLNAMAQ